MVLLMHAEGAHSPSVDMNTTAKQALCNPPACDKCAACFVCHNRPGKDVIGLTLAHTCEHGRKCLETDRGLIMCPQCAAVMRYGVNKNFCCDGIDP